MTSRLGPLNDLPLTAPDFASVCMTATLSRREYLRLVVVRVVESLPDGQPNVRSSRSLGLLVDTSHAMPQLRRAVVSAIRWQSGMNEAEASRISMFTRVSATIVPIDFDSADTTIEHESVVAGGRLRGSMHEGGAVRVYHNRVTERSSVCMRQVQSVYRRWRTEESRMQLSRREREFAQRYITAFQRLGVQRPTRQVYADCECSGDEQTCSCFMSRAMWRAGSNWMIVYALVPPRNVGGGDSASVLSITATTTSTEHIEAPEWLQRIADANEPTTTSQRGEESCAILEATRHDWTRSADDYENELTETKVAPTRELQDIFEAADASLSESGAASESTSLDEVRDTFRAIQLTVGVSDGNLRLPQLAIALQLRRPRMAFIDEIVELSARIGPYFGVVVKHALLKKNSNRFEAAAMRRANELSKRLDVVANEMARCDGSARSFVHAVDAICTLDHIDMSTVENCERAAQTVIVVSAIFNEVAQLESSGGGRRSYSDWQRRQRVY